MSDFDTSLADMRRHLESLGIGPGAKVAVHSRLIAFRRVEGGPAGLGELLLDMVGAEGSVIAPAYVFDPTTVFDPGQTPGEATGALSEYLRKRPGTLRSRCPIHNHAGIGPAAARLLRHSDPASSLGPGSDFDLMHREGFSLLLLGCDFNEACTYLHHMEAMADVPYRRWITVERQVRDEDGTVSPRTCRYFARARDDLITDFAPAQRRMAEAGLLATQPCVFGASFACRLEDLHRVALEMLAADPYALVRTA